MDLLLAQRRLYSNAKKFFTGRTIVSTSLAIGGPLVTTAWPTLTGYVGSFAVAYLVLDHFLLQHLENAKKSLAASLQELFDTRVLDLPWNEAVAGPKPPMEEVASAIRGATGAEYAPLRNWYSESVAFVDERFGKVLCQRSNLYWGTGLRGKYKALLLAVIFMVLGVLLSIGYYLDLSLGQFVAGILFPCLPLLELIIRQIREHSQTASETKDLIGKIDPVIDALCSGNKPANLDTLLRTFQDEIFRHRKNCPLVLDWLYWRLRTKQEEEMQFNVRAKINECEGLEKGRINGIRRRQ